VGDIADGGAFGRAHPLDPFLDVDVAGVQLDIPPGRHGILGDDLHRLLELRAEAGHQVGMAGDHRLHRAAKAVGIEPTCHGDVQLHRVQVTAIVGAAGFETGVEEQSPLQRGERHDVGDPVLPVQFVDLALAE